MGETLRAAADGQTARLAEAFRVFSAASDELAQAYGALENQVTQLTAQLAAANGALRQQYEEKARLSERLSALLGQLPAGVVVVGADGRVESANAAAQASFGAPLAGARWSELVALRLQPQRASGLWCTSAPGERQLAITRTALSGGEHLVVLQDVTELHRLQHEAARHERLAAMGEMAAAAAHQLRTPLAAAMLYLGTLEQPALAPELQARCARGAIERLARLERLIKDMLAFARGDQGGDERIDVLALVEQVAAEHGALPGAGSLALELSQAAGAAVVGNREALAGALGNLLDNAVHAAGAGGRIEVVVTHAEAMVSIAVRDDGPGIVPAVLVRLFEPFFTTRTEGTGLGLAIARGVARAHGGEIDVTSRPGRTEFLLRLPAVDALRWPAERSGT